MLVWYLIDERGDLSRACNEQLRLGRGLSMALVAPMTAMILAVKDSGSIVVHVRRITVEGRSEKAQRMPTSLAGAVSHRRICVVTRHTLNILRRFRRWEGWGPRHVGQAKARLRSLGGANAHHD